MGYITRMKIKIEIPILAREDGINMSECHVTVDGSRKKQAARDVFELDLGCGKYCEWLGEYCENAGVSVYYKNKKLKMEDECECDGRCQAAADG